MRKYWLSAFSSFPTVLSKAFFVGVVNARKYSAKSFTVKQNMKGCNWSVFFMVSDNRTIRQARCAGQYFIVVVSTLICARKMVSAFIASQNIYRTKVTTLHIYSSSKIALILFLRNKMKPHLKISFLGFHLLETYIQRKTFYFTKKEI